MSPEKTCTHAPVAKVKCELTAVTSHRCACLCIVLGLHSYFVIISVVTIYLSPSVCQIKAKGHCKKAEIWNTESEESYRRPMINIFKEKFTTTNNNHPNPYSVKTISEQSSALNVCILCSPARALLAKTHKYKHAHASPVSFTHQRISSLTHTHTHTFRMNSRAVRFVVTETGNTA